MTKSRPWDLEDFMNVKETAVTNGANLSQFIVNFNYALLQHFQQCNPEYSILDLKSHYRGYSYANETINKLPEKPDAILLANIFEQVARLGAIQTVFQPSPSSILAKVLFGGIITYVSQFVAVRLGPENRSFLMDSSHVYPLGQSLVVTAKMPGLGFAIKLRDFIIRLHRAILGHDDQDTRRAGRNYLLKSVYLIWITMWRFSR